jgi:3-isopropylmalate/(R)-2-methylmalate dehydratase large subunit
LENTVVGQTLFEKVWSDHVVCDLGDGFHLLHVDRHLIHDLGGAGGFAAVQKRGLAVRHPELTFATPDHAISSAPDRAGTTEIGTRLLHGLRRGAASNGVRIFDIGEIGQGIVHVIGPELALTLPGSLVVCGDSHTCTHGALGALAFGIGSSELVHVLATQTLVQAKPFVMRVMFQGRMGTGVTAKDVILHLIGRIGAAGGSGYAVEYAGEAIRAMSVEERLTLCNLSIELGAKVGMVAPDDTVFEYLKDRQFAPRGADYERAVAYWRTLHSDADAVFDREVEVDLAQVAPQITWGTSPEHVIPVNGCIPDEGQPGDMHHDQRVRALTYMGLQPGAPICGTPVDWVFIGSCTNSRLSDLRAAAEVARGRRVAPTVRAWVVPGSESVKRAAEAEGLDRTLIDAGFDWREPGCSMCLAANGEMVAPGQRCVSTSNRNFVGRQGPGGRTHLASPAMAAAAAIAGAIVDVRTFAQEH